MYKLLIVEDEEILRNGLMTTIDWTQLGFQVIGCGSDGLDGLTKFRELNADVVLTDIRMPRMSGLDMAKQIKSVKKDAEIVLLSGYDEFSYAKQGLDIGVYNYIMKLNMYEEIDKVFNKLKKHLDETKFNSTNLNELNSLKYRQQITDTLHGKVTGWLHDMDKICVISGFLESKSYHEPFEVTDDYLFVYQIENNHFAAICASTNMSEVIFNAKIMNTARALSPYMQRRDIVVTDVVEDENKLYEEILKAYKLLDIAAKNYGRLPNVLLCDKDYEQNLTEPSQITYSDIAEQLELKRYHYYMNLSDRWFGESITAREVYINEVQKMSKRLIMKLEDELDDISSDYINQLEKYIEEVEGIYSIIQVWEGFTDIVKPVLLTLQKINYNQAGAAIEEAVKYINKNYDKQISTKEIADMINLSPPYFSSSFKKITGHNYSNYVCNVRMEKACELLKTTKLKIYEISHMVGYLDEKHFSKMFSKNFGMTPATYRKKNK